MLRKNSLLVKLFRAEISSFSIFDAFTKAFRPELETCPVCGARSMIVHCYYGRIFTDLVNNKPHTKKLTIMRLMCTSCDHTHAVLPDIIIPYEHHSIRFIMRVLCCYFNRRSNDYTVEAICDRYMISVKQLYAWVDCWRKNKAEWLGVIENAVTSDAAFHSSLTEKERFSDFTSGFVRKTAISFLQIHANPVIAAQYCQKVFAPDYDLTMTTQDG